MTGFAARAKGPAVRVGRVETDLLPGVGVGLRAADVLRRAFRGLDTALGHLDTGAPRGGEAVQRPTHRVV